MAILTWHALMAACLLNKALCIGLYYFVISLVLISL